MLSPTIYGPIQSRRLGGSLGVNVLPPDGKICTFDCAYCECGWNKDTHTKTPFPTASHILEKLETTLFDLKKQEIHFQTITFSGNGEPTLHPDFNTIIAETLALRNKLSPKSLVSVFTNGTTLKRSEIFSSLNLVDQAIIKLDSAIDSTAKLIDAPNVNYSIDEQIALLKSFNSNVIIQSLFLKGIINGTKVDNTSEKEVNALLKAFKSIQPKSVFVYTIDRPTPCPTIQKITASTLELISSKVKAVLGNA